MNTEYFEELVTEFLGKTEMKIEQRDIDFFSDSICSLLKTRSDYLERPLAHEDFPKLVQKIETQSPFCLPVLEKIELLVDEIDNLLRLHDLIDFSHYIVQICFQTNGRLDYLLSVSEKMRRLINTTLPKLYSPDFATYPSLVKIVESVCFTLEGLYNVLVEKISFVINTTNKKILDACSMKIRSESWPKYAQVVDDLFDFAVNAADNSDYNTRQYKAKRDKMVDNFLELYLE